MFEISEKPIDVAGLEKKISTPHMGATVIFQGWVRNNNKGKDVLSLEYEAYKELALKEAHHIIEEVKKNYPILDVRSVHRIGHLQIGDIAICIVVASAHRQAAFDACKQLIDRFKQHLPIWKKEHYKNEESCWVSCEGCSTHVHIDESTYYSRQMNLSSLGIEGQNKLKNSRVLVIGAGGLGCPSLSYLAAAGVGHLGICDDDRLELSNLHRQVLYSHTDLGQYKVELAKRRLSEINPFIEIEVYPYRLDTDNVEKTIASYDLVLDCTDSIKAKFLLHDACFLKKISFIQAGIYQFEGQIQLFMHSPQTSCLRCLWSKIPEETCVGTCADTGVLGVVPGIIGSWQAAEALKVLLQKEQTFNEEMILIDLSSFSVTKVKRPKNLNCPLCGQHPTINEIIAVNYESHQLLPWELNLSQSKTNVLDEYRLLDIRDSHERNLSNSWEKNLEHFPGQDISKFSTIPHNEKILLICKKGLRSRKLTKALREAGFTQVYSLVGGVSKLEHYWKN